MTDQLTTLRRKYGIFIGVHPFHNLNKNIFLKEAFFKYLYKVKEIPRSNKKHVKFYIFASSIKKAKNFIKKELPNTKYEITKFNEQTKLATKAKINTIKSIIDRIKDDWKHIRS